MKRNLFASISALALGMVLIACGDSGATGSKSPIGGGSGDGDWKLTSASLLSSSGVSIGMLKGSGLKQQSLVLASSSAEIAAGKEFKIFKSATEAVENAPAFACNHIDTSEAQINGNCSGTIKITSLAEDKTKIGFDLNVTTTSGKTVKQSFSGKVTLY